MVGVGQSATVYVEVVPGQGSYASTTRNGITTSSYGSWGGSYNFVNVNSDVVALGSSPGTMTSYRGQNGKIYSMTLTGVNSGSVWGSGPYTDDSSLARAAVHAGIVSVGQSATCLLYTSPSPRDQRGSRMPSSA